MTRAKERHQNKVMSDLVRGSEQYYRKHPNQPKEILEENRKSQETRDQWELEHYGTVTKERDPRGTQYQRIIAVPVEIEIKWELDQLVKLDILENLGLTYSEWVERCYKERMKQILTDPAEWGNLMLDEVKRGHTFQDDTLDD